MLSLTNVVHFLFDKFSSLRAGRFAFACVFVSSFDGFFFRHSFRLPRAGQRPHRVVAVVGEPLCLTRVLNALGNPWRSVSKAGLHAEISGLFVMPTET